MSDNDVMNVQVLGYTGTGFTPKRTTVEILVSDISELIRKPNPSEVGGMVIRLREKNPDGSCRFYWLMNEADFDRLSCAVSGRDDVTVTDFAPRRRSDGYKRLYPPGSRYG